MTPLIVYCGVTQHLTVHCAGIRKHVTHQVQVTQAVQRTTFVERRRGLVNVAKGLETHLFIRVTAMQLLSRDRAASEKRRRSRWTNIAYTYPRGRWELRKRSDVPRGHMAGQLEPIPADLLHADLLSLSYVKCGLHAGAGHHWCSRRRPGNACRRGGPTDCIFGGCTVAAAAATATGRARRASLRDRDGASITWSSSRTDLPGTVRGGLAFVRTRVTPAPQWPVGRRAARVRDRTHRARDGVAGGDGGDTRWSSACARRRRVDGCCAAAPTMTVGWLLLQLPSPRGGATPVVEFTCCIFSLVLGFFFFLHFTTREKHEYAAQTPMFCQGNDARALQYARNNNIRNARLGMWCTCIPTFMYNKLVVTFTNCSMKNMVLVWKSNS